MIKSFGEHVFLFTIRISFKSNSKTLALFLKFNSTIQLLSFELLATKRMSGKRFNDIGLYLKLGLHSSRRSENDRITKKTSCGSPVVREQLNLYVTFRIFRSNRNILFTHYSKTKQTTKNYNTKYHIFAQLFQVSVPLDSALLRPKETTGSIQQCQLIRTTWPTQLFAAISWHTKSAVACLYPTYSCFHTCFFFVPWLGEWTLVVQSRLTGLPSLVLKWWTLNISQSICGQWSLVFKKPVWKGNAFLRTL